MKPHSAAGVFLVGMLCGLGIGAYFGWAFTMAFGPLH